MSVPQTELNYEFFAPAQIAFGWGRRADAGRLAAALGRRAWIVCGSRTLENSGVMDELTQSLSSVGLAFERLTTISREPEVGDVDQAAHHVRSAGVRADDFVLAIGGGSSIDLAKAVAALATNVHGESVRDFLEGVGCGLKLEQAPLPIMAVPTTAGTGSEATKNAVISSHDPVFKKSLRSDKLVPRVVLVDPELSVSLPPTVTAQTGMDAITQLLESYLSSRAQPIPEALCLSGLEMAYGALPEAVEDGSSRRARERMAHAALLSGMALANSGLGMAHGVAAALGVHCGVPHGLACALMLPTAMRVNRDVCRPKLARVAMALELRMSSDEIETAETVVSAIEQLANRIGIPRRLSQVGVRREQLPAIVRDSRGNSMSGNPRELSDAELHQVLEELL